MGKWTTAGWIGLLWMSARLSAHVFHYDLRLGYHVGGIARVQLDIGW